MSADEVADVPTGLVTVTSIVPAACAGLVTVICVSLTMVIAPVAFATVPNFVQFAMRKPVPVMVTVVPPVVGPATGEMPVTVGVPSYVNLSADEVVDVPTELVTVTSMVPAACAGLVTVICVSLLMVIAPVAFATVPNFT